MRNVGLVWKIQWGDVELIPVSVSGFGCRSLVEKWCDRLEMEREWETFYCRAESLLISSTVNSVQGWYVLAHVAVLDLETRYRGIRS